jgi:hypothetical protein
MGMLRASAPAADRLRVIQVEQHAVIAERVRLDALEVEELGDDMRKHLVILAGTLVAVAVPAAATPTAGKPPALLVIQVKSVEAGTKLDDNPPQGISKGDRLHERSRLLNVRKQFGARRLRRATRARP